jgi:hypothetical protein
MLLRLGENAVRRPEKLVRQVLEVIEVHASDDFLESPVKFGWVRVTTCHRPNGSRQVWLRQGRPRSESYNSAGSASILSHADLFSRQVSRPGAALQQHHALDRGYRATRPGALIVAAMVTMIAVPMIYRAHTQPPAKALLPQDFGANLTVLLAASGGGTLIAYASRVARD